MEKLFGIITNFFKQKEETNNENQKIFIYILAFLLVSTSVYFFSSCFSGRAPSAGEIARDLQSAGDTQQKNTAKIEQSRREVDTVRKEIDSSIEGVREVQELIDDSSDEIRGIREDLKRSGDLIKESKRIIQELQSRAKEENKASKTST